jgi:hypothetical protein
VCAAAETILIDVSSSTYNQRRTIEEVFSGLGERDVFVIPWNIQALDIISGPARELASRLPESDDLTNISVPFRLLDDNSLWCENIIIVVHGISDKTSVFGRQLLRVLARDNLVSVLVIPRNRHNADGEVAHYRELNERLTDTQGYLVAEFSLESLTNALSLTDTLRPGQCVIMSG